MPAPPMPVPVSVFSTGRSDKNNPISFQDDFYRAAHEEFSGTSLAQLSKFGANFLNQEFATKDKKHELDKFLLENFGTMPQLPKPELAL
ncbi:Aste57867_729 [Aphanomyces stellatus]|uniref:Aste57867_729 protein n=1 Tax=Aphanomyces stellatus TaxID=120398 RepID=A0A485K6L3_9STRA|nr:hypothetical protein As57867_000728 [Aphanomyces stellatus]VFT77953.1 Aste57867_729 [Aphanomyces stellatus]